MTWRDKGTHVWKAPPEVIKSEVVAALANEAMILLPANLFCISQRFELSAFAIASEILNALSFVGQIPRLSKVNLFTLLSLWMELFPGVEAQGQKSQV